MGRYDLPDPICWRKHHKPAGTMSNQPGTEPYNPDRPHASAYVCTRSECQDDAREWVRANTHEAGVFTTFEQNRAASAARRASTAAAAAVAADGSDPAQMALPIGGAS